MSHYHLNIPVDKEDVEIIKKEFTKYLDETDGVTIIIVPTNKMNEPSEELTRTIHKLFTRLLVLIDIGQFKGLN